jgi:hypothetical protein
MTSMLRSTSQYSTTPRRAYSSALVTRSYAMDDWEVGGAGVRCGVEVGTSAKQRDVRLWLVEGVEPNRALGSYDGLFAGAQDEVLSETIDNRGVAGADGHLPDHFPVDELERIPLPQDAHPQHLLVLVCGETSSGNFRGHCHRSPAILPRAVRESYQQPQGRNGCGRV